MTKVTYRAMLLAATMFAYPAMAIDVLPTETANAQDAALRAQIQALDARVTALEKGTKPPDPPLVPESPDLATVSSGDSPTAKLVGKEGHTYSIALGKAVVDGRAVADTGGVSLLKKVDKPVDHAVPGGIFQRNTANTWFGPVTATTGGPPQPGDPSVTAPPVVPPTGDAPAPAAAVGYNTATARGKIVMGNTPNNWRLWDGRADVRTNADGTVTVSTGSSNGYNAHIVTAVPNQGSFLGKTFKGSCGGYYAMQFSFPGSPVQNNGWPSFWANDIENQFAQGGGLAHWPNQAAGYVTSIEVDVVEFLAGAGKYGGALHHWYGNSPYPAVNTDESGSPFSVSGANTAQPHWYGGLHVPATANSDGYFEWYFDNKKVGNRISWKKYNANSPPPPQKGSSAYAVMDERNLYWIAGSGPSNPITIQAFEAWQPRADCTTSQ